jgi:hypothetical protein
LSGEFKIELEGEPVPHQVAPAGSFSARGRRHAFGNAGNQPARVLILCAPSCGLDQMVAELQAATARVMPEIGVLVAIAILAGSPQLEPVSR